MTIKPKCSSGDEQTTTNWNRGQLTKSKVNQKKTENTIYFAFSFILVWKADGFLCCLALCTHKEKWIIFTFVPAGTMGTMFVKLTIVRCVAC